jgi:hypothetical protein
MKEKIISEAKQKIVTHAATFATINISQQQQNCIWNVRVSRTIVMQRFEVVTIVTRKSAVFWAKILPIKIIWTMCVL